MFTNIGKILTQKPIGKYKFNFIYSFILPIIVVGGLFWGFTIFVTSETKPYLMSGYGDCSGLTQRLLAAAILPSERNPVYASFSGTIQKVTDREILAKYQIENGNLVIDAVPDNITEDYVELSKDMAYHEELWDYLSAITPNELMDQFRSFVIFTDGRDMTLSSISGLPTTDVELWLDIVDVNRSTKMTANHIHELGHLVTLNHDQVESENDDECNERGLCFRSDSYYISFVDEFWSNVDSEWVDAYESENEEAQRAFYTKHSDEFVSYYATTHPSEDIAETWTYFVLGPMPTGNTLADQKILFFYGYEELVTLREEIRLNICSYYDMATSDELE